MTLELEERLRRDLPRLADLLEATPSSRDGAAPVDRLAVESASRRSRRRAWSAVAACLVLVAGAAGVAALLSHRTTRGTTTSVTADPNGPLDTWAALPSGPLSPREDATSVWTGTQWLIFGGRQGLLAMDDSAAYEPSTNTWRALAVNPTMHPGAQAVWTGHVVVVLAKAGGWIYDPASDTWADLPRQPAASSGAVISNDAIWTGRQVVAIGVTDIGGHGALGARGLDPVTRTWGPLAQTPQLAPSLDAIGGVAGARWDGTRVQVWLTTGQGWAYDPDHQTWTALAQLHLPDSNPETTLSVTGSGDRTYVLARTATDTGSWDQLAVFENDTWRLVGNRRPGPAGDGAPQLTTAGEELILLSAQRGPEAIDPVTGATRALDSTLVGPGSGRATAWTGDELLVWGGRNTNSGRDGDPGTDGALTAAAARLFSSPH